jgi:hypothetical protein
MVELWGTMPHSSISINIIFPLSHIHIHSKWQLILKNPNKIQLTPPLTALKDRYPVANGSEPTITEQPQKESSEVNFLHQDKFPLKIFSTLNSPPLALPATEGEAKVVLSWWINQRITVHFTDPTKNSSTVWQKLLLYYHNFLLRILSYINKIYCAAHDIHYYLYSSSQPTVLFYNPTAIISTDFTQYTSAASSCPTYLIRGVYSYSWQMKTLIPLLPQCCNHSGIWRENVFSVAILSMKTATISISILNPDVRLQFDPPPLLAYVLLHLL